MSLPTALALFIVIGALFGLLTHAHRHRFSEGHARRCAEDDDDPMQTRLAWTVLCTGLWPLMALTGLCSWWMRRGRGGHRSAAGWWRR
jgi:hypothetical protein